MKLTGLLRNKVEEAQTKEEKKAIYVCDTPKFNAKSIVMNANTVEGIDNSIDLATAVLEGTDIKLFDDCGIEENGAGEKVFKSSNAKIAKIEGTKLIPLKAGSITVTATVDGKSYKLSVKVYDPTLVAPSVVYLNGKNVTFKVSSGVSATTWNCSDSEILSLTEKGVAKGIKTGKVTVTAQNNGRTLKKDIYVCDTPKFNAKSVVLKAGEDNAVDLMLSNLEGTDKKIFDDCGIIENGAGEVTFKSSNAKIAKIEGTELIPIKAGSVIVTAQIDGKSYTINVKVIK